MGKVFQGTRFATSPKRAPEDQAVSVGLTPRAWRVNSLRSICASRLAMWPEPDHARQRGVGPDDPAPGEED